MTSITLNHNFRRHVLHYYNKFARLYDLGEFIRKGTRRKAMSLSGWQPGEKVLDLCTGTGELALTFASQGAPVIGVDIARGMLKVASGKGDRLNPAWLEMDAVHLAFVDKTFEVSALSLALHHMPETVQLNVLKELCRVTRRRIVIIEPGVPVNRNWVPVWKFVAYVIDESEYMHEWVHQDLAGTCRRAGLHVEEVHESRFGLHRILLASGLSLEMLT